MKRMVSVTLGMVLVAGLTGVALAQGWGPGAGRMMGPGGGPMMGPGGGPMAGRMAMMQARAGAGAGCPGWGAATATPDAEGAAPAATPVTEEKAKALATEYAAKYFAGYTVERVLPVQGRVYTMYQVELKGPKGETRALHVNPWGGVRPFAAPFTATN